MSDPTLFERRRNALAPSYQLFYERPVELVRGEGVWVFDADDRRYLDCYNNVPSVGHAHPRVVAALADQAGRLNTHTRYLHRNVVELAERLGESLGGDLGVCSFVCTGTEANDLAVQIARTVTGHHGVIVSEASYHGNSELVRQLSTATFPADERPDWLEAVEPPNTYRGPIGPRPDAGARYSEFVLDASSRLAARGHGVAAMLVDASYDSNGVLIAPPGYLRRSAEIVRKAGGLVIADEVQAGYCRLGQGFWGHAGHEFVPDIVTIGKPMGAGHPVGAVVTTPSIAAAFAERRSYFNTFGGNPVSAAVAIAVLDVIEDEDLLGNSNRVGGELGRRLAELAERHDVIGAVHGSGLFWGLDLVTNRTSRAPVSYDDARRIVDALRERGILTGVTGRYDNVLKIRPPLVFADEHLEILVDALDDVLADFRPDGGSSRRAPGAEW